MGRTLPRLGGVEIICTASTSPPLHLQHQVASNSYHNVCIQSNPSFPFATTVVNAGVNGGTAEEEEAGFRGRINTERLCDELCSVPLIGTGAWLAWTMPMVAAAAGATAGFAFAKGSPNIEYLKVVRNLAKDGTCVPACVAVYNAPETARKWYRGPEPDNETPPDSETCSCGHNARECYTMS